ncbi:MAG TPA: FUSC family protein [Vineibacter sp.]|nr:FUSC family protein [Vineibacter sp.]
MPGLVTVSRQTIDWLVRRRAELRLATRMTVAGVTTFGLASALGLPQGYWAVFTSVIIMQASVGGSLKATVDRLIGTLCGAAYGAAVAWLVPHAQPVAQGLALLIALAPLAVLSALNQAFRVAPVTAIIVLLGTVGQHAGPFESALERVLEIGLGSVVGLAVALLVLPARAHGVLTTSAGRTLGLLADLLPPLLQGLTGASDGDDIQRLLDRVRAAMTKLETATDEARRERRSHLSDAPDPEPFLRTLLRLRHDLVIIHRATVAPLPEPIRSRLAPALAQLSTTAAAFLRDVGAALAERRAPPSLATVEAAFDAFRVELLALRGEGLIRILPVDDVGRLYGFSFALEQLREHFNDMASRTAESVRPAATAPRLADNGA